MQLDATAAQIIKAAQFVAEQITAPGFTGTTWSARLDQLEAMAERLDTGGAVEKIAARLVRNEAERIERQEAPASALEGRREAKRAASQAKEPDAFESRLEAALARRKEGFQYER